MTRHTLFTYILPLGAILLTASCSDDFASDPLPDGAIGFGISVEATRAASQPSVVAVNQIYDAAGTDSLRITTEVCQLGNTPTRGDLADQDNLRKFAVYGYVDPTGSGKYQTLFNNEAVTRSGNLWTTENVQYWLGSQAKYRFLAYYPEISASNTWLAVRSRSTDAMIAYIVPQEFDKQADLMVAFPKYDGGYDFPGDYDQPVPLDFKHILTAIKFRTGSQMAQGTLNSITIAGVAQQGTYNVFNDTWTIVDDPQIGTGSYTLQVGKELGANTDITADDQAMLLLPQTIPDGATISILFTTAKGEQKTYSAALSKLLAAWEPGKGVTYTISVGGDYEFQFADVPAQVDAHYVMPVVTVTAPADMPASETWTLKSDLPGVTFLSQTAVNSEARYAPIRAGFWTDTFIGDASGSARGTSSMTFYGPGSHAVYVFIPENAADNPRTINLIASCGNGQTIQPLTQVAPLFTDASSALYMEAIEEEPDQVVWGFDWNRFAHYSTTTLPRISTAIFNALYGDNPIVSFYYEHVSGLQYVGYADFDYSQADVDGAYSFIDGLDNTYNLYTNAGGSIDDLGTILTQWGYTLQYVTGSNATTTDYYAALCALKRNKFNVQAERSGTSTGYSPVIAQNDVVWYLPAAEQAEYIPLDRLSGTYWTSTAYSGLEHTHYTYTFHAPDGTLVAKPRMGYHPLRAVRARP